MKRAEIVAEIGINHGGDINEAKIMIDAVKACGADVAKFQLYDPYKVLKESDFTSGDWKAIVDSELGFADTTVLFNHCKVVGIEFMASAFDLERLGWLEQLGVKWHKIASRSLYDNELIEAIQATGKPYIVSAGMVKSEPDAWHEIFMRVISRVDGSTQHYLYCVSEYPTLLSRIEMPRFTDTVFSGFTGFSDHTVGLTSAMTAIVRGASLIEKHFTFDKGAVGPDHVGSMDIVELKLLCAFRDEFVIIGKCLYA